MHYRRNYRLRQDKVHPFSRCWCRVCVSLCLCLFHFLTSASVGLLYLWSAETIRRGTPYGIEGALGEHYWTPQRRVITNNGLTNLAGASVLLLVSSLPRVAKGPVPVMLAATSAATGIYYGRLLF